MGKRAKREKQLSFEDLVEKPSKNAPPKGCFGGKYLGDSHAKTKRSLESKLPIHLTLKSYKGLMRTPKAFKVVNETVKKIAKKHGVKIYKYANVGNHLHLVIKIHSLRSWKAFIRELTGTIARAIHRIFDGVSGPKKAKEKFWSQKPYTRIVQGWRRPFEIAKDYVTLNLLEAEGMISRKETKTLADLRELFETG